MNRIRTTLNRLKQMVRKEKGSVAIVIALLTLVVVTILGIMASTSSRIETQIATNDVLYKRAFYSADGGTEITREMIEQNLSCSGGFPSSALTSGELVLGSGTDETKLRVVDPAFAYESSAPSNPFPNDSQRDLWLVGPGYTLSSDDATPHTNVVAFGQTSLSIGSAIQMAAGYEGKGKGAGGAGAEIDYEIHSRHEYRARNSDSYIMVEYRHLIGMEGDCQF